MGAESRDIRNAEAKKLLDFGFANYSAYNCPPENIGSLPVKGGDIENVGLISDGFSIVIDKASVSKIEKEIVVGDYLAAPLKSGESVGKIIFTLDGNEIGYSDIRITNDVNKISFSELLVRIFIKFSSII
jgi:D-alanyl-D-alanine carboxypeptidase (penicillin-binding protein 5/6)